ncbi:MAG: hypothetical protein ACRDJV_00410 [Actinomycetota bacterium]
MSAGIAATILAQVAAFAVVGWVVGDLLLAWVAGPNAERDAGTGTPERALASVAGFCLFACALMIGNIVTGGGVFGSPWPVPVAAAVPLAAGIARRSYPRNVPWLRVLAFAVVLFWLFVLPVVRGGSGVRTGDPPWHLGWTEQLLGGDPVPTGPAPEYSRNAYPWGWHALLATLVRIVPGSEAVTAHDAVHVILVYSIPLAAACLARLVRRRAGWWAAAAVALIGGWGWIDAGGPAFSTVPLEARYGADLVVASPNSVYELFPPAFPRELGLVLLGTAGVLIAVSIRRASARLAVGAGVVIGLVGLVSVPMLVAGLVWAVSGAAVAERGVRIRMLLWQLAGAAVAIAAWIGPLAFNFFRHGGFVNVTPRLGVEWPLPSALWSWGILLPIAVVGAAIARRGSSYARVPLALGTGSLVLLGLSIARGALEWNLGGNATLLHQGRAWPVAHLLGAAFAGVALVAVYDWIGRRNRAIAAAAGAAVLFLGVVSPWLASRRLTEVLKADEEGFIYARYDLEPGSFIRQASSRLDPGDIVFVEDANFIGLMVFQFSGARLARYDNAQLEGNDLRIRFADLAELWDQRMATGGFEPDYILVEEPDAPPDAEPLLGGEFGNPRERWLLLDASP